MLKMIVIQSSVLFFLASFVGAQFQSFFGPQQAPLRGESPNRNPFTEEISSFVHETLEEWKVAGTSIAVIDGDDVFTQGYGQASIPNKLAHSDTLWYAGSTTKAFTAATIARLIDSGEYPQLALGWQTPISSLIRDDFVLQDAWATAQLTLEDAVCHRTGQTSNDFILPRQADGREAGPADVVKAMRYFPLGTSPRTKFDYNNAMYAALSHVIEELTGQWLGDVFRDTIWKPLGMNNTFLDLEQAKKKGTGSLSTGYMWNRTSEEYVALSPPPTGPLSGAGAVISNVEDYAKWLKCLLTKCSIFSEAVHEDIRRPLFIKTPTPASGMGVTLYGLGWFRATLHGEVVYWHSGSVVTHGAMVYWLPNRQYAAVVMMNYGNYPHQIIMRRLVEDKLGIPVKDRYDIAKELRETLDETLRNMDQADNILYPDRPKEPLPPLVGIDALAGSYHAPGWGTFHFETVYDNKSPDGKSLVSKREDFVFQYEVKLRHVSGNFWTVFLTLVGDIVSQYYAAEFRLGIDNAVEGFNIKLSWPGPEPKYNVYFKRVD